MSRLLRAAFVFFAAFAALATGHVALAQPGAPAPTPKGLAVLGLGATRDDAFTLARAVYATRLRPTALDELRARVLAGDPAPETAARDVKDLAELRGSINGDDATSRRLLASIAQQLGVEGVVVVSREKLPTPVDADADAGAPTAAPGGPLVARLFLSESGDYDAARYEPDPGATGVLAWHGAVTSLERRFAPAPPAAPPAAVRPIPAKPRESESKPFYSSPWFWGAVGAAALVGGAFLILSRDTSNDPIHLQMHVPQ